MSCLSAPLLGMRPARISAVSEDFCFCATAIGSCHNRASTTCSAITGTDFSLGTVGRLLTSGLYCAMIPANAAIRGSRVAQGKSNFGLSFSAMAVTPARGNCQSRPHYAHDSRRDANKFHVLCYAKGYALHLLARHHCRSRQVLQAEASRCVMRKILSLLVDLTISILLAQVPSESGEVRYQTDPKHSSCFTPSSRPDSSVAAPLWALSAVPQALSLNRGY